MVTTSFYIEGIVMSGDKQATRGDELIVVDMGGTTTRVGLYGSRSGLENVVRFPTPDPVIGAGLDSIRERHLDMVARAVEQQRARYPAGTEVGVAAGATVSGAGIVRNASMMWHQPCTGFDIAAAFAARLPWAQLTIMNDISATAWRYRHLGRFAVVTVSTGVAVRVFDDALPFAWKLVLDDEGLGGETGHAIVDPGIFDGKLSELRDLGPAAASGDLDARARLKRAGLPWCECGTVADLCSYTAGPAVARAAAAYAMAHPREWSASVLARLCQACEDRVTTYAIAEAARQADPLTERILLVGTRHLAVRIAQLSADLGLRRFVITGGFAHAVGTPWFDALRDNLMCLPRRGGWFTGWTGEDMASLIYRPQNANDDSLAGLGAYMTARRSQIRELRKPVGELTTAIVIKDRPRIGSEQFSAKIVFAGICATDLQILCGERVCEPGILGHECVAEIAQVGAHVVEVKVGDVIALNPNHPFDEHEKIGHNQPGIFTDLSIWDRHLAERGQIIPLPGEGRAEWVLLEPLACAVRAMRVITEDWEGQRVLIVGAGVSGLLHLMLARRWRARQVLVANRSPRRLREAVSRGFIQSADGLPLNAAMASAIRDKTDGHGVDSVIIAISGLAGVGIVEGLWECLADDATIHMFSGFSPDAVIRTPDGTRVSVAPIRGQAQRHELRLRDGGRCALTGSRGSLREDFEKAREMCVGQGSDRLRLAPLVTHTVSMQALPAVLGEMATAGTVTGDYALRAVVDLSLPGSVVQRMDPDRLPRLAAVR
jgi:threonine dehydrogenase-like Zn-dependent dehydrogenase/predicted NBD/HSP70 family sugar kinase